MGYSRVSKHFHLYDWFDSYTHTYSYSHSRYHVFTHIEQPAWKLLLKTICLLLMKKIHIPVEIMNVWQAHIWSILQFDYVSDFFFLVFFPKRCHTDYWTEHICRASSNCRDSRSSSIISSEYKDPNRHDMSHRYIQKSMDFFEI